MVKQLLFNSTLAVASLVAVNAIAVQSSAQSLNPDQVSIIAKQVTVLIEGQNPGSGVILGRKGSTYTVLTAFHVVATPDEYDLVTPDNQRYKLDYKTVKRLPGVDMAVLSFTSNNNYKVAELGQAAQMPEGKPVFVAGFPAPTQAVNLSIYRFTEGRLTANSSRPLADGYALVYDNSTRPGMSGGPVLNGEGRLIGIHGRSDAQQQGNVYFKNDTNLGIPIETLSAMAPKVGVDLNILAPPPTTTSPNPKTPSTPTPTVLPPVPTGPRAGDFYLQATDKLQRGDSQGALNDLNQAIRLNPDYAVAYGDRATIRFTQGDRQGALGDLDQALRLDPQLADAYAVRGFYRVVVGNAAGAKSDVEQALRLKPELGHTSRGVVRWYGSDLQGAQADFDQALRLGPDSKDAYAMHHFRGFVRWQLGNLPGALQDLNQSVKLNPNYLESVGIRGLLRFKLGDIPGALSDLDRGISLNAGNGDLYVLRGMIRLVEGNNSGASADFQRVIQIKPPSVELADMHGALGMAKFQNGDSPGALASLQTAAQLAKDPATRQNYQQLGAAITLSQTQPNLRPQLQQTMQQSFQEILPKAIQDFVQAYRPLS